MSASYALFAVVANVAHAYPMAFPAYATVLSVYAASVVGRIEAMEADIIHPRQAINTPNTFVTFNTFQSSFPRFIND